MRGVNEDVFVRMKIASKVEELSNFCTHNCRVASVVLAVFVSWIK